MARPRATNAEGIDTRQRILAAAMRLIAARGYADTRLAAVAAEAGVSLGLVQHFFGTRAGLLQAAFAAGAEADLAMADAIAAGPGDAWGRLSRLAEYACSDDDETAEGSWVFWLELSLAARRDPALGLPTGLTDGAWRDLFAGLIVAGVEDGTVSCPRPPAEMAADVHALVYGVMLGRERRVDAATAGRRVLRALGLHPAHRVAVAAKEA